MGPATSWCRKRPWPRLVNKLSSQRNISVDYTSIPDANHNFTDKLDDLSESLDDYLSRIILEGPMTAPEVAIG